MDYKIIAIGIGCFLLPLFIYWLVSCGVTYFMEKRLERKNRIATKAINPNDTEDTKESD